MPRFSFWLSLVMLKNIHTIHCATGIPTKKHPHKTATLCQYAIPITEHVRVLCPCLRQTFADWDACDSFLKGVGIKIASTPVLENDYCVEAILCVLRKIWWLQLKMVRKVTAWLPQVQLYFHSVQLKMVRKVTAWLPQVQLYFHSVSVYLCV